MFISISESGPNTWLVEVVDDCWNVWESILTSNLDKTVTELKEMYEIE